MQFKCHLCKLKFERDEPANVRCPRCEAVVRAPLNQPAAPSARLGCSNCLRSFQESQGTGLRCPYCGERVEAEEGKRLAGLVEGLEARLQQQLLRGEAASDIIAALQADGVPHDRAFAFVDRLVLELPFLRQTRANAGEMFSPPNLCDACGRRDTLLRYRAVWQISPEEMQRYRPGWGGFEGDFSKPEHYQKQALYYICAACVKQNVQQFAGGYPANTGFVRSSFSKA